MPRTKKVVDESPKVEEVKLFSFVDALAKMLDGAKMTGESWSSDKNYGYFSTDGTLMLHLNGNNFTWTLRDVDVLEPYDYFLVA